jgi:hypothetical protein
MLLPSPGITKRRFPCLSRLFRHMSTPQDPIFALLPYPGDAMDRSMGTTQVPASSISFANTRRQTCTDQFPCQPLHCRTLYSRCCPPQASQSTICLASHPCLVTCLIVSTLAGPNFHAAAIPRRFHGPQHGRHVILVFDHVRQCLTCSCVCCRTLSSRCCHTRVMCTFVTRPWFAEQSCGDQFLSLRSCIAGPYLYAAALPG